MSPAGSLPGDRTLYWWKAALHDTFTMSLFVLSPRERKQLIFLIFTVQASLAVWMENLPRLNELCKAVYLESPMQFQFNLMLFFSCLMALFSWPHTSAMFREAPTGFLHTVSLLTDKPVKRWMDVLILDVDLWNFLYDGDPSQNEWCVDCDHFCGQHYCVCLVCARKLEHLEETHTGIPKTYAPHTGEFFISFIKFHFLALFDVPCSPALAPVDVRWMFRSLLFS